MKYTLPSIQKFLGAIDYKVGQAGLVNTTVNGFSNKTGYGMTAIVSLTKALGLYQFNWNVQANYLNALQNGMYSQIWFSPNFALNNPQNTTGNFTWLHYVCETFMPPVNTTYDIQNNIALYSGPADLNVPSDDFYDTYDNVEWEDETNDDAPWSSEWDPVNQFVAINGTNATNTTAAKPPVYASGCYGSRLVGKGVDGGYRDLLLNTNVAFRAGFKFWNGTQIVAQSWATPNAFNFTLTDNVLFANNTTPQPLVNDSWTAYFPLLNATRGSPCFNISNPCPANPTTNVTLSNTTGATFFYQKAAPKYYTVQNFSSVTGYGHGVAITLVKYQSGYGLVWNSQTTTNKPAVNGTVYQNWFSPIWGAQNTHVHYICQNDRTVAVTNVTNSTGAVINSTAAITNNWSTTIVQNENLNFTIQFLDDFNTLNILSVLNQQFNDTWLRGVNQSNVSDTTKNFTQGCQGARPLYFNDTRLQTIKYNDTIQFHAGFALFQRNATDNEGDNWAVTQSLNMPAIYYSYKVADTVVKDGVDSCDLLDEEGNCIAAEFPEEETTDSIESTFDEGLQNTGSFRL